MAEERADPIWDPDKEDQWTAFFTNRRNHELAQYKGNDPSPANENATVRKLWWGVPGCTLVSSLTTSPRATTRGS
jgi:hypothetical protein